MQHEGGINRMKRKLLFVIHSNSYGGAEKVLFWLAHCFVNDNYDVSVINLNESHNCSDFERIVSNKIKMINVNSNCPGKLRHFSEIYQVTKWVKQYKPDAIISFTRLPNAVVGLCGKVTDTPTIISERSDPRVSYNSRVIAKLMQKTSEMANLCVFQTKEAQKCASAIWKRKSTVIPNPIFVPEGFKPLKKNCFNKTIVTLGRLENKQKRYDVLIKGFKAFHEKHPDYVLKIFGSGPDEMMIRKWVKEKELMDCVRFMGVSKAPFDDLKNEGVFVITSDFEGVPNSLLEAMAMGFPVVASDCEPGGARMLIKDHVNGIIIPRGDSQALATALSEYANNPTLMNCCGANAVNVLKRFDADRIYMMWKKTIDTILNNNRVHY